MITNRKLDWAALLLRLVFGGLMLANHGWPKLQKVIDGRLDQFGDPLGIGAPASLLLAVFAELLCSVFLLLGLFTRWALAPLVFTMIVATFVVHGSDPLPEKELGLLYLFAFLAIWLIGPGWYSLDARLLKRI